MSHRSVKHTLFYDEDYVKLSKDAKLLFLFYRLMATNIVALYRPDWDQLRALGGWTDDDLARLNAELAVKPWVLTERGFVWVMDGVMYEFWGKEPNKLQLAAVANALSDLPKLSLVVKFSQRHKALIDRIPPEHRLYIGYLYPVVLPVPHTGSPNGIPHTDTLASASPDARDAQDGKPEPKPRALNAQQRAIKDCLDAYAAAYLDAFGKPYPANLNEKAAVVAKWLKGQITAGAVGEWQQACVIAVQAFLIDKTFHPFPSTVPKMCESIPKLNRAWLDSAKANAGRPQRADPQQQALLERARRCTNSGDGCPGVDPKNPVCLVCSRGVAGSKR
jgi:hypothetical protein